VNIAFRYKIFLSFPEMFIKQVKLIITIDETKTFCKSWQSSFLTFRFVEEFYNRDNKPK